MNLIGLVEMLAPVVVLGEIKAPLAGVVLPVVVEAVLDRADASPGILDLLGIVLPGVSILLGIVAV